MNTLKWLLRREFWEHKGGLFWAPVIVGGLMIALVALSVAIPMAQGNLNTTNLRIGGVDLSHSEDAQKVITDPNTPAIIGHALSASFYAGAAPLSMTMGFVILFYFAGALFDDRSNRSVLFWKSLPISDRDTVLSKLITGLAVAPLVSWIAAVAVSVAMSLIVGIALAALGVNVFGELLTDPRFYRLPFDYLALWPIYVLWALPTAGWLLLVSAWARSKPFLWAAGVPLLAWLLLTWANHIFELPFDPGWYVWRIASRILLSATPGAWVFQNRDQPQIRYEDFDSGAALVNGWQLLATPNLWIGVAAGVAMIALAIRLRRYRDEG